MITEEKLKIFDKYKRVIDDLARFGKSKEKALMKDKDWEEIEPFVQDVFLVTRGVVDTEFEIKSKTNRSLR